jgi:hypothetical protein
MEFTGAERRRLRRHSGAEVPERNSEKTAGEACVPPIVCDDCGSIWDDDYELSCLDHFKVWVMNLPRSSRIAWRARARPPRT